VQFGKCLDRAERAGFDDFRAEVPGGFEHRLDGLAGMPAHDEVRIVAVVLNQNLRNADMSCRRQQGQNPRLSQDIMSADRQSAWWRRLDDDPLEVTGGQHDRRQTGDARVPARQILEAGELAGRPHLSDAFSDPVTQFGHAGSIMVAMSSRRSAASRRVGMCSDGTRTGVNCLSSRRPSAPTAPRRVSR
jgi:hypothetical protein